MVQKTKNLFNQTSEFGKNEGSVSEVDGKFSNILGNEV